jgi:amino acid permease
VQVGQVVLLSLSVFAFLMLFGTIIMTPEVLDTWQTAEPFDPHRALVQVSVFLAAFSGLYLTVSTVTDETYRAQFFGSVTRELERAVAVRAVYLALRHAPADVAAAD